MHIESPVGSHAEPGTRPNSRRRSAPGRVNIIAKTNVAMHTMPSAHITPPKMEGSVFDEGWDKVAWESSGGDGAKVSEAPGLKTALASVQCK